MANQIYPAYKTSVMISDTFVNLNVRSGADYVAVSLQNGYTYNAAHQFFSNAATTVGTDQQITNAGGGAPIVNAGVFVATDVVTWNALTGPAVQNLILYRHNSGGAGVWRLVCYLDTGISTLPFMPNGGALTLTWAATGIFSL